MQAIGRAARHRVRALSHGSTSSSWPSCQIRSLAVEPGSREKLLLEEDPALKKFKSDKETVKLIKRIGDILVLSVVAGSVYEIYYRMQNRKAVQTLGSLSNGKPS
ncbi:hypothetical protein O6H91_21G063200 [Diphasiastrum complanatum]|uniref:Uncharacterized protein n=1 Tax=Diphasiastrum complanatum TaxID=34168 RepID=A0ACC2AL58_DIPCM|nr:hypothetical protein O6H91_21G063200 [Diphasiastrum complanatum]